MVWWLINFPPSPCRPPIKKAVKDATESLLVGLNSYHTSVLAIGPKQEDLRAQVQRAAIEEMNTAIKQLARAAKG
jgi:hypothetical protein